jgi:hypothetical protein
MESVFKKYECFCALRILGINPLLLNSRSSSATSLRIQSVPHRKHYVSTTEPNRLMLFRETVAVYCENHTEHTNNIEIQFVPHRKHITSPVQSPTR